jgi:DGQHR domain-containing protein
LTRSYPELYKLPIGKTATDRITILSARKTGDKMKTLTCSAVCGAQKGHRIFTGILNAADLIDITTVDHYLSSRTPDDPKQGYQRPPERSRITRIGTYLIKNIVEDDDPSGNGLFPTAVTLAARTPLKYNEETKQLTISYDHKLQVVDGQHRIEGLRYAIAEKEELYLKDFPIPFVIMETPDRIVEMNQFRTINGTAKSVRTDLVNSILTAIAATQGDSYITDKEKWKVVVTRVIDRLDRDKESPWYKLILMPDEAGSPTSNGGKVVRATSFMTSLKPVYDWLEYFNFLRDADDLTGKAEVVYELVGPYWSAIKTVVPGAFENPNNYVIQKTPGLFSLHKLLVADLVPHMFRNRIDWTWANFIKLIGDSPELTDADFWHKSSGRASSYGSMKGFQELYELLRNSIEL